MERDIIERLMDFDRCGLTAGDRVNIRERAAIEIHNLRSEILSLKIAPKCMTCGEPMYAHCPCCKGNWES